MEKTQLFDPNKIYAIRAEKAGVFIARIEHIENGTAVCNSVRRLYYWDGALDVTQLAARGVTRPSSCKFSVQMGESDKSTIFNLIEIHPVSEKAIQSIQSVREWTK